MAKVRFRQQHIGPNSYISLSSVVDGNLTTGSHCNIIGAHFSGKTTLGTRCVIGPNSSVIDCSAGDSCTVAKNCNLFRSTLASHVRLANDSLLHDSALGNCTYLSENCRISSTEMGAYCSIGPEVIIGPGDHPTNLVSTSPICYHSRDTLPGLPRANHPFSEQKRTIIGNDVWLGARVIVRNGVTIADGAIVGAGSIVTRDIEPFTIVAGTPAKLIRKRTSDENRDRAMESYWWKINPTLVADYFNQNSPEDWDKFLTWANDQKRGS